VHTFPTLHIESIRENSFIKLVLANQQSLVVVIGSLYYSLGDLIYSFHFLASFRKELNTKTSVFIGNLPFEVEDEDLWEFFAPCGDIIGE
tara:strand:- start:53 stop:322 length:270 start_codon:yes stop_codon:yes gene_type:complete